MTFDIFISAIAITYLLGVVVALKYFDRTTDLRGSERAIARLTAGLSWPVRLVNRFSVFKSRPAYMPGHDGMGDHADLYM